MRLAGLALVLLACGGTRLHRPVVREPDASPPAPAPVEIELLHGARAKVAVSSVVANDTIYPEDLVDGKLSTAWNSRTDDLTGGWIAFRVPREAHVTRIRMTVGFTRVHGSDDWFTMNYRIRAVRVLRVGVDGDLGTHALDPANRGLQDIPIDGPGGDFRIEVTDVLPGSKSSWRELCVSELEVWGTLPDAQRTPHGMPDVSVGSLDGAPLPDRDVTIDPLPSFPSIDAFCESFRARPPEPFVACSPYERDCVEHGTRSCGEAASSPMALREIPAGWTSASAFYTRDEHAKRATCNLAIVAGGRTYVLEGFSDAGCGAPVDISRVPGHERSRAQAERHGDLLAITLSTSPPANWIEGDKTFEQLRFCGGSEPACSSAITLGEYTTTETTGGPPGADGHEIDQTGWSLDWKLDGKQLTLSRHDGTVPEEERDRLGSHRLVMPGDR